MRHVILIGPSGFHRSIVEAILHENDAAFCPHIIVVETPKNYKLEEKFKMWKFQRMYGYGHPPKDLQTRILDLGINTFYQLQKEYELIELKQSQLSRLDRERVKKTYKIITSDEPKST